MKACPAHQACLTNSADVAEPPEPIQAARLMEASCASQTARASSIEIFQQVMNGLPEQIALLDTDWNISRSMRHGSRPPRSTATTNCDPAPTTMLFVERRRRKAIRPRLSL